MGKSLRKSVNLFVAAAIASTFLFASAPQNAQAGTLLRQKSCTLSQTNNYGCFIKFSVSATYSCYARIVAGGAAPYASHKVMVGPGQDIPGGWLWLGSTAQSSFSSSQVVYTPVTTCSPQVSSAWAVDGLQAGGGSTNRPYTVQLYSGTY